MTENTIQISHGLGQTLNIIHLTPREAEEYVKQHTDLYEITFNASKKCRAFIDIDGCLPLETTESDFQTTHQMILDVLSMLDPDIKNRLCKSDEWRDAMWFILLDRFECIRDKALDAIPKSTMVQERTKEYITENNAVGEWWEQKYVKDAKSWVQTKSAYLAYVGETGTTITDRKFAEALRFNLYDAKQITSGVAKGKMGVRGWKEKEESLIHIGAE
jgi:hypothetical protein